MLHFVWRRRLGHVGVDGTSPDIGSDDRMRLTGGNRPKVHYQCRITAGFAKNGRYHASSLEKYFLASTVLSIAGVGGFDIELIAAPRLTAHDQVAVILLTILACTVVLCSLGAIPRRRLK